MNQKIEDAVKSFEKNLEHYKKDIEDGKKQLRIFLEKYPYKEKPELIDSLTEKQLYNPGGDDYFFLWIEFKTKKLGAIFTYGGLFYPNAVEKLDKFKQLLKLIVKDDIPISKKIDADWEEIKGFGGDKLIAKKILFCYYNDKLLPIFRTTHMESFCSYLKINYEKKSLEEYGKPYNNLTVGEKYELLMKLLNEFRERNLPQFDNILFARFLYFAYKPQKAATIKRESETLYKLGILFSPSTEKEVVYLFSKFHKELGFPYIVKLREEFPDIIAIDENRNIVRIEIEVFASDFINHKHNAKECDFIVCWENDLIDVPDVFPEIISLKDVIEELEE